MTFVAVSKVRFPPSMRETCQDVGLRMIHIARAQPGFVSIAFHLGSDGNETMMYWEWESEADHEACMRSEDWVAVMEKSGDLFQQTGVEFSIDTYERIA